MIDILMQKIAYEEYDFYPLAQMYLDKDLKKIRIKDGEIAKDWSSNVIFFKFSGEGANIADNKAIQHFVEAELVKNGHIFISGILDNDDSTEYHIIIKNKNSSGKKFDFDKVKFRALKAALKENEDDFED